MKCLNCGQDNKETAKNCRKCGRDMSTPPAWFPDGIWHLKTLGVIYAVIIAAYYCISFALRTLPKPYNIRNIPIEVTPWLRHGQKFIPEDQLQPPPDDLSTPPAAPAAPTH
jgi:hypothetical protein